MGDEQKESKISGPYGIWIRNLGIWLGSATRIKPSRDKRENYPISPEIASKNKSDARGFTKLNKPLTQ
jgi:hypothetical protein